MTRYSDSENEMHSMNERSASFSPSPRQEEDTPCIQLQLATANIQRYTMINDTRLSNVKISEKSIFFSEEEPIYKMDHQLYRDPLYCSCLVVSDFGSNPPCELACCPFHDINNSSVKKTSPKTTPTKSLRERKLIKMALSPLLREKLLKEQP
ncbi:hypothetical protein NPIL_33761 [Nephila pilipes]|uniref:Uncharacterized protein n=1 Tax=Nephila pilipes TaxID=299642 RepID=A0A8X6R9G6_NEPPI|nr:hypothetical protein NPIL_33761 [Nephila pilipes]